MMCERGTSSQLLTPAGVGAIAVIRVTGQDAPSIVDQLVRTKSGRPVSASAPGRIRYGDFLEGDEVIDDVVVSIASTRGEPAIDICAHGGIRVVERILQCLDQKRAPLAQPSSDIWPANSRIEVECFEALSQTKTSREVHFIAWQREHLVEHLNQLAARSHAAPEETAKEIECLIRGYDFARRLLQGAIVALIGPPNSGKSTLFNRVIGRSRAVVSPRAGTTRDWISEEIELHGVPVTLLDTPGRHTNVDDLERRAIELAGKTSKDADLTIAVFDHAAPLPAEVSLFLKDGARTVIVANKSDLPAEWSVGEVAHELGPPMRISAETGEGTHSLLDVVADRLVGNFISSNEPCFFTARQVFVGTEAIGLLRSGALEQAENLIKRELISPFS